MSQSLDFANEEWRPVAGHIGWYEVSNLGRIRRTKLSRGARGRTILKYHINKNGYPYVRLCCNGAQTTGPIHKFVAETFLGPRPLGYVINHIDCNRLNNRPSNLEYVSQQGNIDHAIRLGRLAYGEKSGQSKLTWAEVDQIRLLKGKKTYKAIGDQFAVSASTIHLILNNIGWREIHRPFNKHCPGSSK